MPRNRHRYNSEQGGRDPETLFGRLKTGNVVAPARFGSVLARCFWVSFQASRSFSAEWGPQREDLGAGRCAGRKCHVLLRSQSCGILGE